MISAWVSVCAHARMHAREVVAAKAMAPAGQVMLRGVSGGAVRNAAGYTGPTR